MLILGVDTSGKNGSIALVQLEQGSERTLELIPLEGGTFSAQLVPQISELLRRHKLTKKDIDGFAVVSGPGSFTGLRVGLAAIKALAEVLEKPIAAVSLLEAVARSRQRAGEITAALDAGRGEVYVTQFDLSENRATAHEQMLVPIAELASISTDVTTPDEKIIAVAAQHGFRAAQINYPRADFIAKLGFEKIQRGEIVSTIDLDANYIRRSDAEMKQAIPK